MSNEASNDMSDGAFPGTTAKSIPAADIRADVSEKELTMTRTFPVKQPEEDRDDFVVQVFASTLYRCRRKLLHIKNSRFPVSEVLLGISTAVFGAIAGALATEIKLDSKRGILFYVVLPMLGVGCAVAFFFCRYLSLKQPAQIAGDVLDELPDPDKTKPFDGAKNEYRRD